MDYQYIEDCAQKEVDSVVHRRNQLLEELERKVQELEDFRKDVHIREKKLQAEADQKNAQSAEVQAFIQKRLAEVGQTPKLLPLIQTASRTPIPPVVIQQIASYDCELSIKFWFLSKRIRENESLARVAFMELYYMRVSPDHLTDEYLTFLQNKLRFPRLDIQVDGSFILTHTEYDYAKWTKWSRRDEPISWRTYTKQSVFSMTTEMSIGIE